MFQKFKKIIATALLFALGSLVISGCWRDTEMTPEQEEWMAQMAQWYPDDEFTFRCHPVCGMGRKFDELIFVSKNYPDIDFQLFVLGGELRSSYPEIYYQEEIEDYYAQIVLEAFGCEYVEAEYEISGDAPCEYTSSDEFIENCLRNKFTLDLYFAPDRLITREEMISLILNFVADLDDYAELYFNVQYGDPSHHDGGTPPNYYISVHNSTVGALEEDDEVLIRNMPLDEALAEYGQL